MPPQRGPTLLILGVAAALPLTAQTPATIDQTSGTTATLIGINVVSPTVVWVSGTAGTYLVTVDGGATWRAGVVPGADSLQFRDVHALDAEIAWLLSAGPGEASRIYHTRDGGRSWTEQFRNRVVDAFFDCIGFWDRRRGIAVSDAVDGRFVMVRTEDGANWTAVAANGLPPAHAGEGMFAASGTCLALRGDSLAWLGTGAGNARVLRTTDAGRTRTAAETPVARDSPTRGIASVVFFDDLHGIALGGGAGNADGRRRRAGRRVMERRWRRELDRLRDPELLERGVCGGWDRVDDRETGTGDPGAVWGTLGGHPARKASTPAR